MIVSMCTKESGRAARDPPRAPFCGLGARLPGELGGDLRVPARRRARQPPRALAWPGRQSRTLARALLVVDVVDGVVVDVVALGLLIGARRPPLL